MMIFQPRFTTVWRHVAILAVLSMGALTEATTFVVNSSTTFECQGVGCVTFRDAIDAANENPGPDTITFAIPLNGVHEIVYSGTHLVTDAITIDGTTQSGYTWLTPMVHVKGAGITLFDTEGSVIRGLCISGDPFSNIYIFRGGGNRVEGCFIGTDPTGMFAQPTEGCQCGSGIWIDHSNDNVIGGPNSVQRNLISGTKTVGVLLGEANDGVTGNLVENNWIGPSVLGTVSPIGNPVGVGLQGGANDNLIRNNVISASYFDPTNPLEFWGCGVVILDPLTRNNRLEGNRIGTDVNGAAPMPNQRHGVYIEGAFNNRIGRPIEQGGTGNTISGNLLDGIYIKGVLSTDNAIYNNFIGLNSTGDVSVPNGRHGIHVINAAGSIIGDVGSSQNIIASNVVHGILIEGASARGTRIRNNWIGVARSFLPEGNGRDGVHVTAASDTWIGGDTAGRGNVISANRGAGIFVEGEAATAVVISGNFIGTDTSGDQTDPDGIRSSGDEFGNSSGGVVIDSVSGVRIGGTEGNVISGNGHGIVLTGSGTRDTLVQRNIIGLNKAQSARRGNLGDGIFITDGAHDNQIGGENFVDGNVVSANGGDGIAINGQASSNNTFDASLIGTDSIVGGFFGNTGDGVRIVNAPDNRFGERLPNVIVENDNGVHITGVSSRGNRFYWNYVGMADDGTRLRPNRNHGFLIDGAPGNHIGGGIGSNTISGNVGSGIVIRGSQAVANVIRQCFIGTDGSGMEARPNDTGITIENAPGTLIGGAGWGRNIISGNTGVGISISGATATHTRIEGNSIGTNADGEDAVSNAGGGIKIEDSSSNTVGGFGGGAGNVISGNGGPGVFIVGAGASGNRIYGNKIGTDESGAIPVPNATGIQIADAPANEIGSASVLGRNVISGNREDGIALVGQLARNNVIRGNYIGTDATGTNLLGNGDVGILVFAPNTTIGGEAFVAGNLVSGNGEDGLFLGSESNNSSITGNRIGTDALGLSPLPNGATGITIVGASGITIGGPGNGTGNVISSNAQQGIVVSRAEVAIQGNLIGVDVTGTQIVPNGDTGIQLLSSSGQIGGTGPGAGNVVGGNLSDGIVLSDCANVSIEGNFIGIGSDGVAFLPNTDSGVRIRSGGANIQIGGVDLGQGNMIARNDFTGVSLDSPTSKATIRGNSMFGNVDLGIDLGPAGVTINDADDSDAGANALQNFPSLVASCNADGTVSVSGVLESEPSTIFDVDYYASAVCDASGFGEGEQYLGSERARTDRLGMAPLAFVSPVLAVGDYVSATATGPSGATSEFSQCVSACGGTGIAPRVSSIEVFYNGRYGDAGDGSRLFLAEGEASTPNHYTNYLFGITGVRVRFNRLVTFNGGAPSAVSFEATFSASPGSPGFAPFSPPTSPSFATTHIGGKTSLEIRFADGEVFNRWLKVRIHAASVNVGGLALDGELVRPLSFPSGDGTSGGDAVVIIGHIACEVTGDFTVTSPADTDAVINNIDVFGNVGIEWVFDVDKSGKVLPNDAVVTQNSVNAAFVLPNLP